MQFTRIGPTSDRESSATDLPSGEEYVEFYIAYGECFAAWSGVELNLFAVYALHINSADYASVSASYYSTTGFRAKLGMVDAVVKASSRASQEDRKKWQLLTENASKKSRRRNELAHNTVFFGRHTETGTKKMFLGPPIARVSIRACMRTTYGKSDSPSPYLVRSYSHFGKGCRVLPRMHNKSTETDASHLQCLASIPSES